MTNQECVLHNILEPLGFQSILQQLRAWRSGLMALLICLMPSTSTADNCHISMRVTQSPPRYMFENNQWHGLQIDLAKALMQEAQCQLEFRELPWNRALVMLEKGQLDMIPELSITKEREAFTHYIGPQSDETMVVIVHKNSHHVIHSLDDLKFLKAPVAAGKNTWYGDEFHQKLKTDPIFAKKVELESTGSQLQGERVIREYIAGYVDMLYPWAYRIKHDPYFGQHLKIHEFVVNRSFNYWGFSKVSG